MIKFLAFIAAALPIILFVRSVLFRRPTRFSQSLKEFKQQVDLAISIFLGLITCVIVFALGRLAWAWWTSV